MKEGGNCGHNIFETVLVKKKMEKLQYRQKDFPKAFFSHSAIIITSNFL